MVDRSVWDGKAVNNPIPRLVGSSILKVIVQSVEESEEAGCLLSALPAFFRRILYIVKVFDHFNCELKDRNDAGGDAEWVRHGIFRSMIKEEGRMCG